MMALQNGGCSFVDRESFMGKPESIGVGYPMAMRSAVSNGRENTILAFRKVTASLSLVACIFMIAVIVLFQKYRLFVHRLILYLTISGFFLCTAYLAQQDRPGGPACNFEAFWVTLWLWALLAWVTCITISLLISLMRSISTEKYEIIYHIIGWGIPFVVSLLPFIGGHYGPAGAWCWITDSSRFVTQWRFSIWYGPLIVILIMNVIAYSYVLWKYKKKVGLMQGTHDEESVRERKLIDKEIKPLVAFPLIYMVLYIFAFINRIQNAANPGHPVFALVILQAIFAPLVGAVNAVVYGMDQSTRDKLNRTDIMHTFLSLRNRSEGNLIRQYNVDVVASPTDAPNEEMANAGKTENADAQSAHDANISSIA